MRDSLEEALRQENPPGGALTVILGDMGAGKAAVGFAFARSTLQQGGFVTLLQPMADGARVRSVSEFDRRMSRSMQAMGADAGWRARVSILRPRVGRADSPGTFSNSFRRGDVFPPQANPVGWRARMLAVQDYELLRSEEPSLDPWAMRAMALDKGMNLVLLVDTTGGDREIARVARPAPPTAPSERPQVGSVRVHANQFLLTAAAHRLLHVERHAGGVLVHALKSPQGPGESRQLDLDPGFLAWPPQQLPSMEEPRDRERARAQRELEDGEPSEPSLDTPPAEAPKA